MGTIGSSNSPTKWIDIFHEFIKPLRIFSKEVSSADENGIPLNLWDSQQRFLSELSAGLEEGVRFFVCDKSRQLGITTVCDVIDVFWPAMYPGTRGALVYDTEQNRDENRQILESYIKSFPRDFFGEDFYVTTSNRNLMAFSNNSRLNFLVAGTRKKGVSWAEGKGISYCHASEVSKYGDPQAFNSFIESLAQVNPNRLFILESTANGINHFKDMYYDARDRDTVTKRAFFIGWWASDVNFISRSDRRFAQYGVSPLSADEREKINIVRERYRHVITAEQLAWIRWKMADPTQDEMMLQQNQPWYDDESFVITGYSFFPTRKISKDMNECRGENGTLFVPYRYLLGNDFFSVKLDLVDNANDAQLRVYEQPVAGEKYVIGVDPAWGRNEHKDGHAIEVFRCFSDKALQVAEFRASNIDVKQFAWIVAHLAGAYEDCYVNVEITGPGRMIMSEWEHVRALLKSDAKAKEVASRKWDNVLDNAKWYLYHRIDSTGGGFAKNFETTWRTKWELMHQFHDAYNTEEIVVQSVMLLNEMSVVVQNGNEIGAPESKDENCKDDRVFASALAIRAWYDWVRPGLIAHGGWDMQSRLEKAAGELTPSRSLNDIIHRFFMNAEQEAEERELNQTDWKTERGL